MEFNHVTIIVTDLERSIAFYEKLGLELIVYSAPRYARFALPNGQATFSVEVTAGARRIDAVQSLIYFECRDLNELCGALSDQGVSFLQLPADMPYLWREAHLTDPDGHEIRLYSAGKNRLFPPWRLPETPATSKIWTLPWRQDRKELSSLFSMADDSEQQIASYLYRGEIIAAVRENRAVGFVQIVPRDELAEFEIKSIAVCPQLRSRGLGSRLVQSALRFAADNGGNRITVSTSIAAANAIGFYLKQGFRICGFARDSFTPQRGYSQHATLSGLPLDDAVEFEMLLGPADRQNDDPTGPSAR